MTQQTGTAIYQTKPHFEILDGLRGVAAIAVVCFHFMEMVYFDYTKNFIAHGFLAVDFFFCLSGFVIGYAYDDRIGKMSVLQFFKARLIRLHPLVILGTVLGLLAFLFDPFSNSASSYNAGKVALLFLASVLMIPYPVMGERGFNLFGLNAPAWSLFWEYVANIVYALVLHRVRRSLLIALTVLAGGGIIMVAIRSGNVMGGWGGPNFWDGGVRIAYSFLAGLLVHRSGWAIKNRLGFPGLAVLLALTFVIPFGQYNYFTEPLVILFFYPLLIALGAGAKLTPQFTNLCKFSGNISYPLYMTHYAVIWMFLNYHQANKPDTGTVTIIILAGMALLLVLAYIVMLVYDTPLRKYLNAKRRLN